MNLGNRVKYGTEHTDEDIQTLQCSAAAVNGTVVEEDSAGFTATGSSIVEFNFDETPEIQDKWLSELRRDGKQAIAVKRLFRCMEPSHGGQLGSLILAGEENRGPVDGRIGF